MRRPWQFFCVSSAVFTIAFAGPLARVAIAQSNGRITGVVRDSAQKTTVAFVTLVLDGKAASRSGADGRYSINGVAPGQHTLRTQLLGYAPRTDTVQVGANEAVSHDFVIRATGTIMQQMVVVGYGEQRRATAIRSDWCCRVNHAEC